MGKQIMLRLPQDLLAEALWSEWFFYFGVLTRAKIKELLRYYNLKPKKGKGIEDVYLALGRGLKDSFGSAALQREHIAEEIDKVCVIADWEAFVGMYKYLKQPKA